MLKGGPTVESWMDSTLYMFTGASSAWVPRIPSILRPRIWNSKILIHKVRKVAIGNPSIEIADEAPFRSRVPDILEVRMMSSTQGKNSILTPQKNYKGIYFAPNKF